MQNKPYPKLLDEVSFMDRFRGGDEKAFNQVYEEYNEKILWLSLSRTGDMELSKDIVQEVFIRLWASKDISITSYNHINKWITTTCLNYIDNYLRQKEVQKKYFNWVYYTFKNDNKPDGLFDRLVYRQFYEYLLKDIAAIKGARKRQFAECKYLLGMNEKQLQDEMNWSIHTVKDTAKEIFKRMKTKFRGFVLEA